jgi:predicted O-methyltransferase YrrM
MIFEEVERRLAQLGYQSLTGHPGARLLYDFVLGSGVEDVLELGFAHGTSTCYIAAALDERGRGLVTTIDRETALSRRPNIQTVLGHLRMEAYVRPIYAPHSYVWELMHLIERQASDTGTDPCFDFCFVDGAHTWEADGFAFFLVDKLLRPDRWLLFDDLNWTHATSPSISPEARQLPEEEQSRAQIKAVFELLVRQHPSYRAFRVMGNYGWAYKALDNGQGSHEDSVDRYVSRELMLTLALGETRRPASGEFDLRRPIELD